MSTCPRYSRQFWMKYPKSSHRAASSHKESSSNIESMRSSALSKVFLMDTASSASIWKVAPGYDVRIVNNMGIEVARGEQGNIGVRCKPEVPPGLFQISPSLRKHIQRPLLEPAPPHEFTPAWSSQARALRLSQG